MQWLKAGWAKGGAPASDPPALPAVPSSVAEVQQAAAKLREAHELCRDAAERGYQRDAAGDWQGAVRAYRIAEKSADEGLAIVVPTPGLDPAHSSISKLRADLHGWREAVAARLHDLDASGAGAGPPPRNPLAPPPRPAAAHSPSAGAARGGGAATAAAAFGHSRSAPAAARRGGGGAAGGKEEREFEERVLGEVLDRAPAVAWEDVAGLGAAKQALQEMVILPSQRSDLFKGLRAPARGLLLYGPPGNGKTLLARALAAEASATFFAISASSLTSRWHGDAERLVRTLFRVAAAAQPAIIFIDEIDSILSERSASDHEASRRLKTEFLVQFDGVAGGADRVVVIGATNRPWDLDEAVRRRLPKRIYIPLPDAAGRRTMLEHLLAGQRFKLDDRRFDQLVHATPGYSGSDLAALCKEAAMGPIRELPSGKVATVAESALRPLGVQDFAAALRAIRPSVSAGQLARYEQWAAEFGGG